ncbi:TPA: ead/Ea22-like family protein [Klebsiella quasipneumoniae]
MTDITELALSLKAAAEKATQGDWRAFQYHDGRCGIGGGHNAEIMVCEHISKERPHDAMFIALANPANVLALVEALEKAQQAPSMPLGLHPDTQKLVADFCTAIADKLYKAQLKYGYDTDWKQDGWPSQCQAHFHQHIAKGDPRDVAAYCAFMWWHGWSTKPPEGLESRTVTVKLPDYRNTYKSPLADEVEHQVRLALELFSSAAGIKVEAE